MMLRQVFKDEGGKEWVLEESNGSPVQLLRPMGFGEKYPHLAQYENQELPEVMEDVVRRVEALERARLQEQFEAREARAAALRAPTPMRRKPGPKPGTKYKRRV